MAFDLTATLDVLRSHAQASGWFAAVTGHEPKSAPIADDDRLFASFWLNGLAPVKSSGLASTSALLDLQARLYASAFAEPRDAVELVMGTVAVDFMGRVSGDFTLGGNVRNVDLMGSYGAGLNMRMGYLDQDGRKYRIAVVSIPCIVNDLFTQAE